MRQTTENGSKKSPGPLQASNELTVMTHTSGYEEEGTIEEENNNAMYCEYIRGRRFIHPFFTPPDCKLRGLPWHCYHSLHRGHGLGSYSMRVLLPGGR